MQHRDSLHDWSLPCGTWFGVRARISPLFALVLIVLLIQRWEDVRVAALFVGCLLISALVHELAHVFALRTTGATPTEMLLWPLGGVTRVTSMSPMGLPLPVALAGPLVSLALAVICLVILGTGASWSLLNPFALPAVNLDRNVVHGLLALTFFANWLLVVANVLPAMPFDGGRVLEAMLASKLGPSLGQQTLYRCGVAVGVVSVVSALLVESVWFCAIGAGLIAYNLRESLRQQMAESFDESFMGYDFSQGYTSLERSVPVETEVKPGVFQRWLERRRAQREERRRQKAEEAERELDFLLAKVHTYGIDSLSDSERRILKRASARYRDRSKR